MAAGGTWLAAASGKRPENQALPAKPGILAGPVRFELTMDFSTPVFKTGAFNRSATDPQGAHDSTERTVLPRPQGRLPEHD